MPYSIKQVSRRTGLSVPTLRFYDREGLFPGLKRSSGGYRVFSEEDLAAIELIECFKQSGLTLREIRHFMDLVRGGDATLSQRLAIFREHTARLGERLDAMQAALDHSRQTLEFYELTVREGSERAAMKFYE